MRSNINIIISFFLILFHFQLLSGELLHHHHHLLEHSSDAIKTLECEKSHRETSHASNCTGHCSFNHRYDPLLTDSSRIPELKKNPLSVLYDMERLLIAEFNNSPSQFILSPDKENPPIKNPNIKYESLRAPPVL